MVGPWTGCEYTSRWPLQMVERRLHLNYKMVNQSTIEQQTKVWDKIIVARSGELSEWADILGKVYQRKVQIYVYANNHYAGFGPAIVEMFRDLWRKQVAPEVGKAHRAAEQGQLFK